MKLFHSEGGNNRPYFKYRFKVQKCTKDMFYWCINYPDHDKPFCRFHVEWDHSQVKEYDIVQTESRDAYLAFQIAFAGEILEDVTIKDYR